MHPSGVQQLRRQQQLGYVDLMMAATHARAACNYSTAPALAWED
jgi:hypothetical protein